LDKLLEAGLLDHKAILVVHHHKNEAVREGLDCLKLARQRQFGDNLVSIFLYFNQEQE
jgi:16S rRNA G966 N2-methylase RsmD